jgi:hypothetical protein
MGKHIAGQAHAPRFTAGLPLALQCGNGLTAPRGKPHGAIVPKKPHACCRSLEYLAQSVQLYYIVPVRWLAVSLVMLGAT